MHRSYWGHQGWQGHYRPSYRGGFFFWPGLLLVGLILFGALKFLWPLLLIGLIVAFCSKSMVCRQYKGEWGEPEKRKNTEFYEGENPKRKNDEDTWYM